MNTQATTELDINDRWHITGGRKPSELFDPAAAGGDLDAPEFPPAGAHAAPRRGGAGIGLSCFLRYN